MTSVIDGLSQLGNIAFSFLRILLLAAAGFITIVATSVAFIAFTERKSK